MTKKYFYFVLIAIGLLYSCKSKSISIESEKSETEKTTCQSNVNGTYEGTINSKTKIKMLVNSNLCDVEGVYFYDKQGIDIKFKGIIDSKDNISLDEFNSEDVVTAVIKGKLKNDSIVGTWESKLGKRVFQVSLKRSKSKIAPLPKVIEGNYTVNTEETGNNCDAEIRIIKLKDVYNYELKTKRRVEKGKIKVTRADGNNYFEFGNLSGLIGVDGTITIQNYGNSMNYYLELEECEEKYIILKKVE